MLMSFQQDPANEALGRGVIACIHFPEVKKEAKAGTGFSSIAFSLDGKTLAAGCSDKTVRIWEARSGKPVSQFEGHEGEVTALAFLSDGTLASGSSDGTVRTWDVAAGKSARVLATKAGVLSLTSASRGTTFAAGCSDHSITAWEVSTGRVLFSHKKSSGAVRSIASSPDGKLLVSIEGDMFFLRLWDTLTGKEMRDLQWDNPAAMLNSVAWSPDGKKVAAGVYGSLRLWDVETGKKGLECFAEPKGEPAYTNESIVFSPDGSLLATASGSTGARLWDATTGRHLLALKGPSRDMTSVAFSSDRKLFSASDGKTITVWDLATVLKK
jgi:WD40 repeat protein